MNVDAAMDYLDFVHARHEAYLRRQAGEPQPWSEDPVVATRKFTNVFRVLDYGTQFLIRELLDPALSEREVLMRCFLYRHTNRPSAWMAYRNDTGDYPLLSDLDDLLDFWMTYDDKVFSGAYMIYPQSSTPGTNKVESIIELTKRVSGVPSSVFLQSTTQADRFESLRRNKGVADFMAMQILTDYGYSSQCGEDRENEFVVAGPGAKRGAAVVFPDKSPDYAIRWATEQIADIKLADCGETGWVNRSPSYMDAQNTWCEFSKYVRYAGKPAKAYKPEHPGPQPEPVLPSHWRNR